MIIDLRMASPILTAPAYVNGKALEATLDSGCGAALVHARITDAGEAPDRRYTVIAADGNELAVRGVVHLKLTLFESEFMYKCIIVDGLDTDIILGTAFLDHFGFDINFTKHWISVVNQGMTCYWPMPCKEHNDPGPTLQVSIRDGRVVAARETELPPRSAFRVTHERDAAEAPSGAVRPARWLAEYGLEISTNNAERLQSTGMIRNSTTKRVQIPAGSTIGICSTNQSAERKIKETTWTRKVKVKTTRKPRSYPLKVQQWTRLVPNSEIEVTARPVPPEFEHGEIVPSTKWLRQNIVIATQRLPHDRGVKMLTPDRRADRWLHPGDVIGRVLERNRDSQTLECRYARGGEATSDDPADQVQYYEGLPEDTKKRFRDIFVKRRKVFEKSSILPEMKNFEYTIVEPPNLQPVAIKPIRMSPDKEDKLVEKVDELVNAGVLEDAGPCGYNSRAFLVNKKEPGQYRFIVDFSQVGRTLPDDTFPVANIGDVKNALSEAKMITCMDLSDAYFTLRLSEKSRRLTTFSVQTRTVKRSLRFTRCPQGLKCSGSALSRAVAQVFGDLQRSKNVVVYADDVFIVSHSEDYDKHLDLVDEVLRRCEEYDLKMSPKKVKAGCRTLTALGWQFTCPGVAADPEKVEAINNLSTPKTWAQLRSMYGMFVFFKSHIKNFDEVVHPIVELLRPENKHKKHFLTPEAESAIKHFKKLLTEAPILQPYQEGDQIVLAADASTQALGYHVMALRKLTGNLVTLCFGSKTLTVTERNYPINLLELMACAYGILKHPEFFRQRQIHVLSDHKGIVHFDTYRSSSSKINRLLAILAEYQIVFHHIKGKMNVVCDYLSRFAAEEKPNLPSASEFLEVYKVKVADETPLSEQIRAAQKTDKWCVDARKFIEEGVLPDEPRYAEKLRIARKNLEIKDDMLCHSHKNKLKEETWTVVVPRPLRKKVLRWAHTQKLHPGAKETLNIARDVAFWPSLRADAHRFVSKCAMCARVKRSYARRPAGVMKPRIPQAPFQTVSVDWVGELPMTPNKNRYFLICEDLFSRWTEIWPAPARSAERAIKILERFFASVGFPETIVSDSDVIYRSGAWTDACKKWRATTIHSAVYKQRANRCERGVQKTKVGLRFELFGKEQKDWDQKIPRILHHINNRTNLSTNFSPAEILYGKKMTSPTDREMQLDAAEGLSVDQWIAVQGERIQKIREIALENATRNQNKYLEKINKGRDPDVTYTAGQEVWVRNRPQSDGPARFTASLDCKYKGPFKIEEMISNEIALIKDGPRHNKIHIEDLKPYIAEDEEESDSSDEENK